MGRSGMFDVPERVEENAMSFAGTCGGLKPTNAISAWSRPQFGCGGVDGDTPSMVAEEWTWLRPFGSRFDSGPHPSELALREPIADVAQR